MELHFFQTVMLTCHRQISSGLSRPKLIDRGGCTAELPDLTLEGYNPSPMEHMKMQSQLTRELAERFGAPKNIISTAEVQEYKEIILAWVRRYPKIYDFYEPDMTRDSVHPWIFPHRFYLYTMACLLILNPIRHYMVKSYTKDSPPDELQCRADGLFFSLILIKTQRKWVDKINGRDGRLHFIIFSIFDTAAILCTALVKDHANTIENKQDVLYAIAESTAMLKALINISETAKMSHDILYRLTKKLKKPSVSAGGIDNSRKRTKLAPVPPSQQSASSAPSTATVSPGNSAPRSDHVPSSVNQISSVPPAQPQVPVAASYVSIQQPQHNSYATSQVLPPQLPAQVSTSAAAHSMPPPMLQMTPQQLAPQQMRSIPQHPSQMPLGVGFYQPAHPPVTEASLPPPMNQSGSRSSPPMPPVGYSQQQPPPLGNGIFNMNVADGVPAIANLWDAPPTPMAPMISYSIMGHNVPVNVVPEPRELLMGQQQQEHVVPELNLSNLTEAEIGGLAPLWNWHSSNLFPQGSE